MKFEKELLEFYKKYIDIPEYLCNKKFYKIRISIKNYGKIGENGKDRIYNCTSFSERYRFSSVH